MDKLVRSLLQTCGRTYSAEAGIKLADRPGPLYQLLVLTALLSTRIRASVAVAAARELFAAGYTTPERMRDASWQDRVNALGRAHYVRYDESTATALGEGAELVLDAYRGDLRRLRDAAGGMRDAAGGMRDAAGGMRDAAGGMRDASDGDVAKLRQLLQQVPRIGPVGADIFCREAQAVWPRLRPYLDKKTLTGARRLGLPADPKRLASLVPDGELARLSAGLVHVSLDQDLVKQVKAAA